MTVIPAQVTFRGLRHSAELEAEVLQRVARLEQFYGGVVRCHALVELPHRHRQDGRQIHVRLELTVPGRAPIVVSREPSLHADVKDVEGDAHHKKTSIETAHRHAIVAIRDAFDVARRRLEDVAREQRGAVKTHAVVAPAMEESRD